MTGLEHPGSALARTVVAQREFQGIADDWARGAAHSWGAEAALRAFLRSHPEDGRAPLARTYLGWVHLERGDVPAARVLALPVLNGPPGTARDLAAIVEAGVRRRSGDASGALLLLLPLANRVVDPGHRLLHERELNEAAIAAERWDLVPRSLQGRLDAARAVGLDATSDVRLTLDQLPARALESTFLSLVSGATDGGSHGWLTQQLWRRLAGFALAERDSTLAALLLDEARGATGSAFEREALRRLASKVRDGVTTDAVGLLLDASAPHARKVSADVAAGAVAALQLGEAGGSRHLKTRFLEPGEPVAGAIQALVASGARVVVAGVTAQFAAEALVFAETHSVPLLLLAPPAEMPPRLVATFVLDARAPMGAGLNQQDVSTGEALGHDAVLLGHLALTSMRADEGGADPAVTMVSALSQVESQDFWLLPETGFGGDHLLVVDGGAVSTAHEVGR